MAGPRTCASSVGISGLMRAFLRICGLVLVLALGVGTAIGPLPAHAQVTDADGLPDYAAWSVLAGRAESALADDRASISAFEVLRTSLVEWRALLLSAQDANATRIATLNGQIQALGAAPEEGGTEAPEIAERRAELNKQLTELQAPRLRAIEAFNRADGLIGEIDAVIRARETERLLALGPVPLNPAYWPKAAEDFWTTWRGMGDEVSVSLRSDNQRARLSQNLPLIIALLVAAYLAAFRLPRWFEAVILRFMSGPEPARQRLRQWLLGCLGVVSGTLAVWALAQAAVLASIFGIRGQVILDIAPMGTAVLLGARWLAPRLLHDMADPVAVAAMVRNAGYLAILWIVAGVIDGWADVDLYAQSSRAVLSFPLIVLSGLTLFRMATLVRVPERQPDEDGTLPEPVFRERAQRSLRLIVRIAAIVSPLAAAVGYSVGAGFLIFPMIETLGAIAILLGVSAFVRDLYGLLRGKDDEALVQSLTPVLFNLGLVLFALPFILMLWGMRPEQLTEIWSRFQEGFQLGETRITPGDFLTFAVVFALGYGGTRLLQSTLRNSVLPKTRIDPGGQTALVSGLGYVGIVVAAFVAISSAGIDLSSLAIVAGALSVGIGFGLQNIVSNFVSGIILLIERPISEGDWIEVGGQMGYVRDISVRSTRIETFDRSDVIVPNADLVASTVTNYTRGNLIGRVIVPVGVAYGTDTKLVERILLEIAEAHPMVTLNPPPSIVFQNFGADALEFEVRAILRDVNWVLSVKSDINHEIARRFAEEGIEIPFAQRDIWLRNPEALSGITAPPPKDSE
jgi:small-conductance mechanosensitive channel